VSKSLWGKACLAIGREAGGYFRRMVAKAKAGELNLARTIWGLRSRDRRAGAGEARSPRQMH